MDARPQQHKIDRRESELRGGAGRRDEVDLSGVYPASGPFTPPGNADIREQSSWGQGERGAEGYRDHGTSQLRYTKGSLSGYDAAGRRGETLNVQIPAGGVMLEGELTVPDEIHGFVLFAHGSGSSRHSPRNQYVARVLQATDIGTLLFDLLTSEEDSTDRKTAQLRFDIDLLARRLRLASDWVTQIPKIKDVKTGYFGASTGAAAALIAAGEVPEIGAVVSRGGRPDMAGASLPKVRAPTLLIVGGRDHEVIELNRKAMTEITSEKRLEIIPGATHLFEEPGALEEASRLAQQWFERHLGRYENKSQAA